MMEPSKKFMFLFDRILFVGLGCSLIALCLLACGFIYTFRNPPGPASTSTGSGVLATATVVPILPTDSFLTSTPFPTFTATVEGLFPSPLPNSNDGSLSGKIVFTCYIKQIDQICIMNADGSGRKQLTDFSATTFYASLSPDGARVYFVSKQTGAFEIYSMDTDGKDRNRLTNGIGSLYAPELSPDGQWIIFTKNGDGLWLMRPDGKNPHRLTDRDDIDPTWSPDGSMISFASSRAGNRQLFIMNADGSNIQQLTDLNNMGGRSTWSPDGKWIAFYRGPQGDHNIYVVNVETKEVTRLTNGGDNLGPSWSPDGNWITFTSFRDGNNEIYAMHPDGSGVTRLTSNTISDWQPRWGR